MKKILVLSRTPWTVNNSFGNTFTNLFSGYDDIEVANICCQYGTIDRNDIVNNAYQITETDLIKNIRNRSYVVGRIIQPNNNAEYFRDISDAADESRYNVMRKLRLTVFFWVRDLIWKLGDWKNSQLVKFIEDFSPDLIYIAIYPYIYMLDIAIWLQKNVDAPSILHVSDDDYSLKQLSLSPFYWINRFIVRKKIRKLARKCKFIHVITEKQKIEYERCLHKECRVFKKTGEYKERSIHALHKPIFFVYTGGIGDGRWRTLVELGRILDKINNKAQDARNQGNLQNIKVGEAIKWL